MKTLMKQYNGKIAWEYRHYPIPQLHKKAFHESEALECAWEQGNNIAFWKYVDEIYTRTQSNDSLNVSELPIIAKNIGLDITLFNTCLASGKFADKIESDIMAGKAAGVQGTPTSFLKVNGEVVDMIQGAQPIEVIQEKIDALLK
jgi:protein-disulfide isomerase